MALFSNKIFKLNRLKFNELYEDASAYIRATYGISTDDYSAASPWAMLLTVVLHLGRMILFFISDSLESLSIKTAYRPDSIRGLAQLTGHEAAMKRSARAAIRLVYKDTGNMDFSGRQTTITIPNRINAVSNINACNYNILFGSDAVSVNIGDGYAGNSVPAYIIEGDMKIQKATGTGLPMQSYTFAERSYREVDQDWAICYYNGQAISLVKSFLDMGYNQKAAIIKSSLMGSNGNWTLFFGNRDYGFIPEAGSTILLEYIVSSGLAGNLDMDIANQTENAWEIKGYGILPDGTQVNLNEHFSIQMVTSAILASESEDITLTQRLAPHMSRSFVLANETNYKFFFERMGIFKTVEVVTGQATEEAAANSRIMLDQIEREYNNAVTEWQDAVAMYGQTANETLSLYEKVQNLLNSLNAMRQKAEDAQMANNTVYLMLVPDASKRISSSVNYFTCSEEAFLLTEDEQANLLQLIEDSGQKILTIENRFLQPKTPRFSINANVKLFEGYSETDVYSSCIKQLSDYFLNTTRKDIIPLSDITAMFENVAGIDSVKLWFDADIKNEDIYGSGNYGIDNFGDILLSRQYTTANGSARQVRDILPLFRGGFTSPKGVEYSDVQSSEYLSAFNLNVIARTVDTKLSLDNPLT